MKQRIRLDASPYRKATRMPVQFRGIPRRRKVLVIACFCVCLILLLPRREFLGKTLWFFLLGSDVAGPYDASGPTGSGPPAADILKFIDPLIGTTNGGHVFPGASLPYGMAKAVADTHSPAENAAGYVSDDGNIIGFSHMHDSGTGGQPSMGNFPLFVHPGCPEDDFAKCEYAFRTVKRVPGSAIASAGYFSLNLTNSVRAEMTVTQHTALYRFSFPGTDTVKIVQDPPMADVPYSPVVVVDLIDLMNSRRAGGIQVYPETGRVVGEGQYSPSFGSGHYQAFFCADFKGAKLRKTGTFLTDTAKEEPKFLNSGDAGTYIPSGSAGAWLQFEKPEANAIYARVGLSFISVDKACENAEDEIPDFGFERVEAEARQAWTEKLSVIDIDAADVSEELQTTFWSGLYRTMLSPQNYTGENPLWNSTEPYFDSFYCIWDSFRAQHPLLTIVDPVAQTQMVRALIDIYRHEGKLPDCRMHFCKGFTQGGSNADIVIADAFVKKLTAGIDWDTAYQAVVSDAEVEPANWGLEGRGNLVSWHSLGFIPWNDVDNNGTGPSSRTISRGVEYAYDDFCISSLASALGHTDDAAKYSSRGGNWVNYWNPAQKDLYRETPDGSVVSTAFTGFMQPREANGSFRYQNTRTCSPIRNQHSCYYDTGLDTYEGSPWLYSFFVPQNMAALISLMGGAQRFVDRLTYFHESGIAYMGNEQAFLSVFQFHYAARPALSSYWAHRYIPAQFNASVNGIPGNDDCAMGAFSAFALMGFFPVAGQDVYLLTPPFFPQVRIKATATGKGKTKWAVIRVRNFDPENKRIYIKSATLNGRRYTRNWITHEFFLKGGLLELEVAETEGSWGTGEADLPPSYDPATWK
ncbi:glycosyl hydrolase family 92-domain-containing protein [Podospora appendiculata]|uniref:Glycosyl hydrolase family 92-domain-containing protein n=1 Tax=Podospora appendiculata TaxID=314037 RepID=A0AAE1C880_9PEZI|nr:glycosyl hydrolase family 92-domain-containing protein [Podospora appendiculata]